MGETDRYIDYRRRRISFGADGNALMILVSINAVIFLTVWFLQIIYYMTQSAPGSFENDVLPLFMMPPRCAKWAMLSACPGCGLIAKAMDFFSQYVHACKAAQFSYQYALALGIR